MPDSGHILWPITSQSVERQRELRVAGSIPVLAHITVLMVQATPARQTHAQGGATWSAQPCSFLIIMGAVTPAVLKWFWYEP